MVERADGGEGTMKCIILKRDKVVKIRYNENESINDLLEKLMSVPGMELEDKGYRG